jgi:AmmeMemoRadiSam system protein B
MGDALRRAAFAGSWYPRSAAAIVAEVEGYLGAASPGAVTGRLVGIVSPHAGLQYSGPVAAYGYSLLRGRAAMSVVLVGPSHRAAFEGMALQASGAWETPLGSAPIDEELAQALLAAERTLFDDPGLHRDEHSLEMQMPFLQRLMPGLRIVPVLMGTQSRGRWRRSPRRSAGRCRAARCCSSPRATSRTTSRPRSPAGSTPRWWRPSGASIPRP